MTAADALSGMVPADLKVCSARILLESLEVSTDIGFHDFEIGSPQRLKVTVEIWLEDVTPPADDHPKHAPRPHAVRLLPRRRVGRDAAGGHGRPRRARADRGFPESLPSVSEDLPSPRPTVAPSLVPSKPCGHCALPHRAAQSHNESAPPTT